MSKYSVYSPFDLEQHKATFTNYLEVLIDADGKVMYAVPSHQEKAVRLVMERLDCTREAVLAMCPPEYYFDYMNWLLMMAGNAMAVWDDMYMAPAPTLKQIGALRRMKMAGVYHGAIPNISVKSEVETPE